MTKKETPQSYSQIFRFWLPLALTWLMMSVEGPYIAAIIARLAGEKLNLAAYGIAFAFALVAESPVIMLMSAATALCRNCNNYLKLRDFSILLSLAVTILLALFLIPPIFNLVIITLLDLPADIARLAHTALLCFLPWPSAIGIRRFYQGVLITAHKTRRVAFATVFRLLSMSACAFMLYNFSHLNGAIIGAIALSTGVCFEALFTRYLARHAIKAVLNTTPLDGDPDLNLKEIWNYYLPLAMTPFIALSVHPLVTFFLGKSLFAIESLAVMPVIHGLSFVFRSVGLSYQEVAIALIGENRNNYRKVRNFAICLGITTTVGLSLIAFTPLNRIWFHDVSGLSPELADFALHPLQILAIFPALTVLISFQRSVLIVDKVTKPVSLTTLLEAGGIFAVLAVGVIYSALPGAVAAAIAYVSGRLLAITVLHLKMRNRNNVNLLQE
jgi:progressive ankylosis protein